MRTFVAGTHPLAGVVTGFPAGAEAVLLVHPANMRGRCWDAVMAPLAEAGMPCVAPDLRGHGASHRRGPFSVAGWAEDCAAILAALELPRVHAIGASVGAAVAVELAVRHPERVARVTTVGGAFLPADDDGGLLRAIDRLGVTEALRRDAREHALAPGADAALVDAVIDDTSDNDRATAAAIWRAALATDVRPALAHLRAPCAVIVGALDATCPPAESAWFARATSSPLTELAGVGHLAMYEAPAAIAERVAARAGTETNEQERKR